MTWQPAEEILGEKSIFMLKFDKDWAVVQKWYWTQKDMIWWYREREEIQQDLSIHILLALSPWLQSCHVGGWAPSAWGSYDLLSDRVGQRISLWAALTQTQGKATEIFLGLVAGSGGDRISVFCDTPLGREF